MYAKKFQILGIPRTMGIILLLVFMTGACGSQPTAVVPTNIPPTQLPTTIIPPSPTTIPSTETPEAPVPVTSYEEIVGKWKSRCGSGPCIWDFRRDGTYQLRYTDAAEAGPIMIEAGKIAFYDGIFHFQNTSGGCYGLPDGAIYHGYYVATLILKAGELYKLDFESTQPDECSDRQASIGFTMIFVGE